MTRPSNQAGTISVMEPTGPFRWVRELAPRTRGALPGSAWIRLAALMLVVGTSLIASRAEAVAAATAAAAPLEYKVKAGYLFNFGKFVEWPAAALPAQESPFVIGVLDDGGEAQAVMQPLLEGKSVNGHPVQVKAVAAGSIGKGLHILFVTRAAEKSSEGVQAALGESATLLVGESDGFAQHGGIMNFVTVDGRVKFEVNLAAAKRSGLELSSQLLKLAIVVEDGRPHGRP